MSTRRESRDSDPKRHRSRIDREPRSSSSGDSCSIFIFYYNFEANKIRFWTTRKLIVSFV